MASTEGKTRMVRLDPTSLLLAPSTVHMLPPRPLPLTASSIPDIRPRSVVLHVSPWLTPATRVPRGRKFRRVAHRAADRRRDPLRDGGDGGQDQESHQEYGDLAHGRDLRRLS